MSCTICYGAMPEGGWCRACGEGLTAELLSVAPMTGLRLAVRKAHGGPLSTDGPAECEAFYRALAEGNR